MKEKIKKLGQFFPAVAIALAAGGGLVSWRAPEVAGKSNLAPVEVEKVASKVVEKKEEAVKAEPLLVDKGNFDLADGEYEGAANGYRGEIRVKVTIKDRTITAITILASVDDVTFFERAKAVTDKMIAGQSLDVDVVSGATYSSNGIIGAVKNALTGEVSKQSPPAEEEEEAEALSTVEEPAAYLDGTYTGSGVGFQGAITTVSVTVENGQIVSIDILSHGDTPSYFASVSSVIDAIVSGQTTNVDTVNGATFSSNGIIAAVREALSEAVSEEGALLVEEEPLVLPTEAVIKEEIFASGYYNESKAIPKVKNTIPLADGLYRGTSFSGYQKGEITLEVAIKEKTISSIKVLKKEKQTPEYWDLAVSLLNEVVTKQTTQVDTVSNATFSSVGILDAIDKALSRGENPPKEGNKGDKPKSSKPPIKDTDPPQGTGDKVWVASAGKVNPAKYKPGAYQIKVAVEPEENEIWQTYDLEVDVKILEDGSLSVENAVGSGKNYLQDNDMYIEYAMIGYEKGRGKSKVEYKGLPFKLYEREDLESLTEEDFAKKDGKIDAVTGATYSSWGIYKGVLAALEEARIK